MARGRKRATTFITSNRRKSTPRRRRSQTARLPRSAVRNTGRTGVKVPCVRDFHVYPKNVTSSVVPTASWLDSLRIFGTIALKLFIHAITSSRTFISVDGRTVRASASYVTSAVQSVFIGPEDVLWSSPFIEREEKKSASTTILVPCVDFRQCRLNSLAIRLTPGSAFGQRAGRYAAAVLPLSEDEIMLYQPAKIGAPWNQSDSWSFQEVVQMHGAITAPFGTPITLNWRPLRTSYGSRFLNIGQRSLDGWDFTKNLAGGNPVCRLVVAYQDYASSDGSYNSLYSPNEALLHVDLRGSVELKEPGRVYIRSWPITTMNESTVGLSTTESFGKVVEHLPLTSFHEQDGRLFLLHNESPEEDLQAMALN